MPIARLAAPVTSDRLFDYWVPDGLAVQPGSVLRVMLGRRRVHGVAVEVVNRTDLSPERLSPILEIVAELPLLPTDLCGLAKFVAAYYQQPIGQCFAEILPPLGSGRLRQGKKTQQNRDAPGPDIIEGEGIQLNAEQRAALADLMPRPPAFGTAL